LRHYQEELLKERKIQYDKLEQSEQNLSKKLDVAQSTIEKQTYLISGMRENPPKGHSWSNKRFFATLLRKNS
jgi:hypothetical protein